MTPDALGFGTTFWIIVGLIGWVGLASFIAPLIGRWIKGDFEDHGRERVGLEPSDYELWLRACDAAAQRGEVHAARARRRRLDAMERERAVYEDGQERAS